MSYKKFLVDNPTCSRRYHLTFDDAAAAVRRTEVRCTLCGLTIFTAADHPPVTLAREENLTKTSQLADLLVNACNFQDTLSKRTIPELKDQDDHVYPKAATDLRGRP